MSFKFLDHKGNTSVLLAVGAAGALLAGGFLFSQLETQSVSQTLRRTVGGDREQLLTFYSKRKIQEMSPLFGGATDPCTSPTPGPFVAAPPPISSTTDIEARCFTVSNSKILQARFANETDRTVSVEYPSCGKQKWIAYTYSGFANNYIYLSPLPAIETKFGTRTLYVLNSLKTHTGGGAAFLANPVGIIEGTTADNFPGNSRPHQALLFNTAELLADSASAQTAFLNSVAATSSGAVIANKYLCARNRADDDVCHVNNGGGWMGAISSNGPSGPFHLSATDGGGSVTFRPTFEKIGEYCACTRVTDLHPSFDLVESRMKPYLTAPGNLNIQPNDNGSPADEMPLPELQLRQYTDLASGSTTFSDDDVWQKVKATRNLPSATELIGLRRSSAHLGVASGSIPGGAIRYVYSFTAKLPNGIIEEILTGTEHNTAAGRKIYLAGQSHVLQTPSCSYAGHAREFVVYTNTIPRFNGRWAETYDDYRGGGANGVATFTSINNLCAAKDPNFPGATTYRAYDTGEVMGWNYACLAGAAPSRYFHNGNPGDTNGGSGRGWCESTAVEWVRCREP